MEEDGRRVIRVIRSMDIVLPEDREEWEYEDAHAEASRRASEYWCSEDRQTDEYRRNIMQIFPPEYGVTGGHCVGCDDLPPKRTCREIQDAQKEAGAG